MPKKEGPTADLRRLDVMQTAWSRGSLHLDLLRAHAAMSHAESAGHLEVAMSIDTSTPWLPY